MTGTLRTMFTEQADTLGPLAHDLAAIEAKGQRRVRRRRLSVAGAAAAAVALSVGLASVLPFGGHDRGPVTARDAIPLDTLTYAAGSVLYSGDRTERLGRPVGAMVQTTAGVVFTSGRTVWEWQGGDQRRLGTVAPAVPAGHLLQVDPAGTTVAWVDPSTSTRLAVLDVSSGRVRRGPVLTGTAASVRSVSDGVAYLATAGRLDAVDVRTLRTTRSWPGVAVERVLDVRSGWFLTATGPREDRQGSVLSRTPLGPGRYFEHVWTEGTLSPSATRLFSEGVNDDTTVLDAASGRRTDVTHRGFYFAAGYRWLDDDRFLALGVRREGQETFSLLTCSVSRSTCRLSVADIGTFDDVAVPFGVDISDD